MKWLLRVTIAVAAAGALCGLWCAIAQGVLNDSAGWMTYGFGIATVNAAFVAINVRNYRRSYGSNRTAQAGHTYTEAGGDMDATTRAAYEALVGAGGTASPGTGAVPLESVNQEEPIRAWRGVRIVADGHTVCLWSINHQFGPFTADEKKATCGQSRYSNGYPYTHVSATGEITMPHTAPGLNCDCGFYGVKNKAHAVGIFIAEADFYGTVIEHELGYRAEYQRILSVRVVRPQHCTGDFLCDGAPELIAFPPDELTGLSHSGYPEREPGEPFVVCAHCALGHNRVATLQQLAARLGVEVRWADPA